ncbi:MAG: hypothetical protein AAGA54_10540 [Myxococcota bacterium]
MNWKTLLVCSALAMAPLACDSEDAEGNDSADETEGHDTDGHDDHGDETEGHDDEGDDDGHSHDGNEETEVITTVTLTFTSDTADTVTATFQDLDGDGGASGTSEPITLAADTTYTMTFEVLNELEDPAEDVTAEIAEEAEEHFVLVYGDVDGPASAGGNLVTHAYADVESDYADNAVGDDLPVGLSNTITTNAAGVGELSVMLRHLPQINDEPQKTADLPMIFQGGSDIAGDVDVDVTFDLTVE